MVQVAAFLRRGGVLFHLPAALFALLSPSDILLKSKSGIKSDWIQKLTKKR